MDVHTLTGWQRFASGMLVVGVAAWLALPAKDAVAAAAACELNLPASAQAYPCGVLATGASSSALAAEIGRQAGAAVRFQYRSINGVALDVPNARAFEALRSTSLRLYPDRPVRMIFKPDGKGPSKSGSATTTTGQVTPEGVGRIGGPSMGVTLGVAIVDTGIDLDHPDLKVGAERFDAFSATNNGDDLHGHGTHVAGIVAARNNGIDVVGVVPDATVYAVRVLDSSGSGSDAAVIAGLDWVAASGGKVAVVNMSLGRPVTDTDDATHPMRLAVQAVTGAGIPVVVAAGNDATKQVGDMVPAGYPEVLAVASTTARNGRNECAFLKQAIAADTASYFTTDGAGVAISAPGAAQENVDKACMLSSVGILSLQVGGGTMRMNGTSMAAPHVAGVAAVLKSKGYGPGAIRDYFLDANNLGQVFLKGKAPYNSPTRSYSFDGVREGIVRLPAQ